MMQEPDESELTVVRVKENFRFGPNAFPTLEYSYAKTTPWNYDIQYVVFDELMNENMIEKL